MADKEDLCQGFPHAFLKGETSTLSQPDRNLSKIQPGFLCEISGGKVNMDFM